MKKIEKRSLFCLLLAGLLALGLGVFTFRFFVQGSQWASFPANRHLYADGGLSRGRVLDRNGQVLVQTAEGRRQYHDSWAVRLGTMHAVGDAQGRVGSGVQTRFAGKLAGYNPITGVNGGGQDLTLTLDAQLCAAAYSALDGRRGTVGIYNYKTGEILCMVSSPSFDPQNPPEIRDDDPAYEGVFVNRMLGASVVPGSIFKAVTTAAAIDVVPDLFQRTFRCEGRIEIGGAQITCSQAHGDLTIGQAFTKSCNCVYGQLAVEIGAEELEKRCREFGLTESFSVDGAPVARGSFVFDETDPGALAWSGVGQGQDLVNPCSMMVFMGAAANGGQAARPQLLLSAATEGGWKTHWYRTKSAGRMMSQATADQLAQMMRDNVVDSYGEGNLAGLELCAKSGTAENGGETPHAWFAGFLRSEEYPFAFIVLVENSGSGSRVAGAVAKKTLAAATGR